MAVFRITSRPYIWISTFKVLGVSFLHDVSIQQMFQAQEKKVVTLTVLGELNFERCSDFRKVLR